MCFQGVIEPGALTRTIVPALGALVFVTHAVSISKVVVFQTSRKG
jgi:hypothetical protein